MAYYGKGTSSQVLTDQTAPTMSKFATAPGGGIQSISGTLTNSQIKNLHGTPIQILAAQGAGKVIVIISSCGKLNYGGNNAFTAGASQSVQVYFGAGTTATTWFLMPNSSLTATSTQFDISAQSSAVFGANSAVDNQALYAYNPIATEISGNAANDNTITYQIDYLVVSI